MRDSIEGREHAHSGCVATKRRKKTSMLGGERECFNVREKERELQCYGKKKHFNAKEKEKEL